MAQTHGVRNAGVGGKITAEDTKKGLKDVVIEVIGSDKKTATDKEGRYGITPLSSGKYKVKISKEGYETQILEIKVNTGVISRLNVTLKPIATV